MIQFLALSWLVLRLTDSPTHVGILLFIMQGANFLVSPLAGVLSDRYSRYKLLFASNALSSINDGILATIILMGIVNINYLYILTFFSGIIKGFDLTIRTAFINNLVKKEQLVNAISLNSSMFNVAKIVGPGIAGILVVKYGEGICFLINSLSYLVVLTAILLMKNKTHRLPETKRKIKDEMLEGLKYTFSYPPLRIVVVFIACIGMFGFPYMVVLPVFAKDVLMGNADTLGFLTTFGGVGALISALYMATRKNALGLERIMFIAGTIYSSGIFILSFMSDFSPAAVITFIIGFGQVLAFASANSSLQTIADKNMVGRVLSIYITLFMGATMVGCLIAGKLTDLFGVKYTLIYLSVMCFTCTMVFGRHTPKLKRFSLIRYVRLGVISANVIRNK